MSESNNLSLQGGTGPKRGGDQSKKSDEKWTHLGNDDDLRNGAKTCIINSDGVFGIHNPPIAPIPVLRGHAHHQILDALSGPRSSGAAVFAAIVFAGNQLPVPSQK